MPLFITKLQLTSYHMIIFPVRGYELLFLMSKSKATTFGVYPEGLIQKYMFFTEKLKLTSLRFTGISQTSVCPSICGEETNWLLHGLNAVVAYIETFQQPAQILILYLVLVDQVSDLRAIHIILLPMTYRF